MRITSLKHFFYSNSGTLHAALRAFDHTIVIGKAHGDIYFQMGIEFVRDKAMSPNPGCDGDHPPRSLSNVHTGRTC